MKWRAVIMVPYLVEVDADSAQYALSRVKHVINKHGSVKSPVDGRPMEGKMLELLRESDDKPEHPCPPPAA
jgi:hypothetical protein